jgi:membrane carboxypeptidase/penicillin-binding protein
MKITRFILKIIEILLIATLLTILTVYVYFKKNLDDYIDVKDTELIINDIKSAKNLPEKFYEIYEQRYPGSLTSGFEFRINRAKPSIMICEMIYPRVSKNRNASVSLITRYFILEKAEAATTQKECLNCLFAKHDFLSNNIGPEQASIYYFNKQIEDLNDNEIETIINMLNNASYYNPHRRR